MQEIERSPTGPPLILLVPDQATYQMERALLDRTGFDGFLRVFPLSFRRLAYRIFGEVGGSPLPVLDDVAKQMFLALVVRKERRQLCIFQNSAEKPGLLTSLAQTLKEFRQYGKTPEDVVAEYDRLVQAGRGETPLALKLHDLALIYRTFEEQIRGRYVDREEALSLLANRLRQSAWIRGARIWVDGFSGFTPQEYDVLACLVEQAQEVTISLCIDPDRIPRAVDELDALSPFHPVEESYLRIRQRIPRTIPRLPTVRLGKVGRPPHRFRQAPCLAHLESVLLERQLRQLDVDVGEIVLVEAADRRTEVRAAARDIVRLVRDKGCRYRDIAVIVRDLGLYSDLIRPTFAEYGIHFFIDERRSMAHHPLVELVRSAVHAASTGWSTEGVLQYLKTDLVPVDRAEIDEVENYVLEFGVRGGEWFSDGSWGRRSLGREDEERLLPNETERLERVDEARRKALAELRQFGEEVSSGQKTVREITGALCRMLDKLRVPETLRRWAEEARAEGLPGRAEEHAEAWKSVVGLLGSLVEALGDESLPLREYATVLEAGLSQLALGLIPPSLDQVTVGSVERSRHPELRAAFVLGVGEGTFPRAKPEDPILNDGERDDLEEEGFELAPSTRRDLHRERYFAYIALTRARENLWVSYPISGDEGRQLLASTFVRRLRDVFPRLEPIRAARGEPPGRPEDISLATELAILAASGARRRLQDAKSAWWAPIYDESLRDPETRERLARVLRSLAYSNEARLPENVAGELYGPVVRTGVTSLEIFAACPFRHFAERGLGLRERPEAELKPVDLGALYHDVLRSFFLRTRRENLRWAHMDPEQARAIMDEETEAAIQRLGPALRSGNRDQALLEEARRSLGDLAEGLVFHFSRSDFEPVAAEQRFDRFKIDLGDGRGLKLRGSIDRIDAIPGTSPPVVRVVDYKTREQRLDLWKVEEGLALQLTAYLLAVEATCREMWGADEIFPAGCFFSPIRRGFEGRRPAAAESPEMDPARFKGFRLRGLFSEEFAAHLDRMAREGEWSPTHGMFVNKSGGLGNPRHSDYLPAGMMEVVLERTRQWLGWIGRRVLAGAIPVRPFQTGNESACRLCRMRPVCRFEPRRNRYRRVKARNRADIIGELGKGHG